MKKFTPSTYANLYLNAAKMLGLNIHIDDARTSTARIYNDHTEITIVSHDLGLNSRQSKKKSTNKELTSHILKKKNIPVPNFGVFVDPFEALIYAQKKVQDGIPIVVKPSSSSNALGITLKPKTKLQLVRSIKEAFGVSEKVLIEDYIDGQHYRVTVLDDEIIAVTLRISAYITTDGIHSVEELLKIKNNMLSRAKLPIISLKDKDYSYLKCAKIKLSEIYGKGENIRLRTGCGYVVGDERVRIDIDSIPHINQQMFKRTVRALQLRFGGVDYISPDITIPYTHVQSAIHDVNSSPHQDVHFLDSIPNNNYAAERIIEKIFERNT